MGNELSHYSRPELTKEFVEHLYRSQHNGENIKRFECKELEVGAGSEKGDNFLGDIKSISARVIVDGEEKKLYWIAKMMPDSSGRISFSRDAAIFPKEVEVYLDYLPRLEALERAFCVGHSKEETDVPRYCEVIYSSYAVDEELIIMENLRNYGFIDSPLKKSGFDLKHCLLVAEWLAKFHALGYAFVNKFPKGIDECFNSLQYLKDNFLLAPNENIKEKLAYMCDSMHESALEQIKLAQEPGQDFEQRLRSIWKEDGSYFKFIQKCLTSRSDSINVVCHGDTWFNNMFFRYEDGEPVEVILFDLQVIRYCNPCNDLVHFFYSGVGTEGRKAYLGDFLQHYHKTFISIIKKYGFDENIYSLKQLKDDFHKATIWGVFFSIQAIPTILVGKEDTVDMNEIKDFSEKEMLELMEKDKKRVQMIIKNNDNVRERIFGILKQAVDEGVI